MDEAFVGFVGRYRLPAGDAAIGDDEPDLAVMGGARRIARARFGAAIGMAVIMADDMAVFSADVAMRRHQDAGIDFKACRRVRMHILRRHDRFGEPGFARHKAAAFVRKGSPRLTQ